jgi:hypothetical protein
VRSLHGSTLKALDMFRNPSTLLFIWAAMGRASV